MSTVTSAVSAAPIEAPAADAVLASQKDNIKQLEEISRNSQTTFLALILACVYSFLTIATTTDAALMSNSNATPLPIIQVNVSIVWFYIYAPLILTVLFVYFHLYLERFWRGIARLPLYHPDGRGLDDYVYPWLISSAVIRGERRELSASHRFSALLEAWLSLFLGWGLVPVVLLCYWARYAVAHHRGVTLLHILLILLSIGFAMHYLITARNALRRVMPAAEGSPRPEPGPSRRQAAAMSGALLVLGAVLVYLSESAMRGLAADDCQGVGAGSGCATFAPGRQVWEALGIEPYSVVKEGRFTVKPGNWQQLLADPAALRNYLDGQRALVLESRDLRSMNASEAFMPGSRFSAAGLDYADLSHAVMTGSRLDGVSLRGAKLRNAAMQHMDITDTQFDEVRAEGSRFDHATFSARSSERPMRLSGDFSNASFDHSAGDGLQINPGTDPARNPTKLIGASLRSVKLGYVQFHLVDLGSAPIEDSTLAYGRFVDTDFSGARIRRSALNFSTFVRCKFIGTEIEDSLFEEAVFEDSEFDSRTFAPGDTGAATPRKRVTLFQAKFASFDAKTRLRNLHFDRAELRSAKFQGTQLANVSFSRSDLSYATFIDVDLAGVSFDEVDLSHADLSRAKNVTLALLQGACGNGETRLPPGASVKACRPGTAR